MAMRRRGSVKPAKTVLDPKTGQQKPAPGTTWWFQVDVGEGANRKQVKRRGFNTKAAAQEALTAVLERSRRNEHVDFSRMTLIVFLMTIWLPRIKLGNIEITTWERYASDIRLHVQPHDIADRPLQKVDGTDFDLHWDVLKQKTVRGRGVQLLSARSVHSVGVTLRKAMRDAVRWGYRIDNPTDRSEMPVLGYRAPRKVWTADELNRFLEWARTFVPQSRSADTDEPRLDVPGWLGDRLYSLWVLIAYTGMRRGESLALAWDDLHIEPGQCDCSPRFGGAHLVIRRAIRTLRRKDLTGDERNVTPEDKRRGWQWSGPKTDAGYRTVSLDTFTVGVLREWRLRQKAEKLALGVGWHGQTGPDGKQIALVFTDVDGGALHPKSMTDIFARRTVRFGNRLNIHGLRHTWATIAMEAGVHPKIVQKRLGHTRIQTTLDLYSHVRPQVDADAAQTVADVINTAMAPDQPKKRAPRRKKAAGDNVTPLEPRRRTKGEQQ